MTPRVTQVQDTIYALAASGAVLYAARASGLYRSLDGGTSWLDTFALLDHPKPLAVTALAVVGSTIFAGVNGAVLRSDDAGDHWQIVPLSSPAPQVAALAVAPNFADSPHSGGDGIVIAGTAQDGVFVSTDRGATWTPWNFGLIDLNVYALAISPDFSRDQTVFAGTLSGMFRSQNGGRSWRETSFPMDAAPVLSFAISSNGLIFAGTEAHGLYISDDFGASWRQVSEFASAGVNAIQISAGQTWLLTEDRLLSLTDGSSSWQTHDPIPEGKVGITMLPHPTTPGMIIVGCADGDLLQLH